MADIWASTEEVEYEKEANKVDLEAMAAGEEAVIMKKKKKKKKKQPAQYFYKDNSNAIQGPFEKGQMKAWVKAGFFPMTTLVRSSRDQENDFRPLSDVKHLHEEQPETAQPKKPSSVQDRIKALKQQQQATEPSSVQDRIAALRKQNMPESEPQSPEADEDEVENSVQDRIAALRKQNMPESEPQSHEDEAENSVQDRIAALRAQSTEMKDSSSTPGGETDADNREEHDESLAVQQRIAALRQQ